VHNAVASVFYQARFDVFYRLLYGRRWLLCPEKINKNFKLPTLSEHGEQLDKRENERYDTECQYDSIYPCSGHEEMKQLISRPEETATDNYKEQQHPEDYFVYISG